MADDRFKIDGHKLIYHPQRTAAWLRSENIAPLYAEISPAGACNHRCVFCSVDFMGYKNRFLETGLLASTLQDMGQYGVKSIMFAGEGEPFLHRDIAELTLQAKASGLDVAFTTNGTRMTPEILEKILPATEWIKVSCNGGSPETYAQIHRSKPDDFDKVIANLAAAVEIREKNGWRCTLGIQLLLLPENQDTVTDLAATARKIGLDYLVVKPYTKHRLNQHRFEIQYNEFNFLAGRLAEYNSPRFQVIFREQTMRKWDEQKRNYKTCRALPFWTYLDSRGNIYGCSSHLDDPRFCYGNIHEKSFREIWEGEQRAASLRWTESELDINNCKLNCRMDEVNRYLRQLKKPGPHVNFI